MYNTVYRHVEGIKHELAPYSEELSHMFGQCYTNTLKTTVEIVDDGTTFVLTGDIPAMWLRDSTAQIRPYLRFCKEDQDLQRVITGLIKRHAQCINHDPYANAFNKSSNGKGHQDDRTIMSDLVWERKFELDSLCYPVQLCYEYWKATGDGNVFDSTVFSMFHKIIDVMKIEQNHDNQSDYRFEREDLVLPSDTLPFQGKGTRTNYTGMVWSGFRPSDDACKFGYLIPSNMFAVVILEYMAEISNQVYHDEYLSKLALNLRGQIDFGIRTYGRLIHPKYGEIFAYETDGFGNYNFIDDANIPSLLSIPYLGYVSAGDRVYQNTRSFILSGENPYYFEGKYANGIGSAHTPNGHIWPLALIMQGLTSMDQREQKSILNTLMNTTAGTSYMHESFHSDNCEVYTREWFGWANSLFGEFVLAWLEQKEK